LRSLKFALRREENRGDLDAGIQWKCSDADSKPRMLPTITED
jgi:hypothetical protein